MDKRRGLIPRRFIKIKGVFSQLAIKGDKAFLIFTVFAAFIPSVGCEIEQIPDVGCPEPGAFFNHLQHMLVIKRLVFFGVITFFRVRAVEGRVCVCTVLRESDYLAGKSGVIFIEKFIRLFQLTQIPAKIQIIAVDIRNLQNRTVDFQHEDVCHGGQTGGIHPVTEIIEKPVVFQQVVIDGTCCRDLVGEPPNGNRGVVVTLGDQFTHLVQCVLAAGRHVHGDIRDLCPDNDAVFVAEIIKLLRMLIMCQTKSVGPKLPNNGHVGCMVFIRKGVALALQILVTADASKRIAATVEEEPLLRVAMENPAAKAG